jgi:hypothetical protein
VISCLPRALVASGEAGDHFHRNHRYPGDHVVAGVRSGADLHSMSRRSGTEIGASSVEDGECCSSEAGIKTPKSGDERRVRIYTEMFGCEPFAMLDEACKGRGRDASVLRGPSGDAPCAVSIDEALHRLQRRIGTPEHRFNCFRHWFATTLLRRRVNIEAVRRMMGHSSLAVTQRYLHLVGTDYDPPSLSSGQPLFGPKSGD